MLTIRKILFFCLSILFLLPTQVSAQKSLDNITEYQIGLLYRSLAGSPPDFEAVARQQPAFRAASEFERLNVLTSEVERIRNEYAEMRNVTNIKLRIRGSFSEYDGMLGGYNLTTFAEGTYALIGSRQLRWSNSEEFRTWKLSVNDARGILQTLNNNRSVIIEISAKPFAADTANIAVRAQIREVRISTDKGNITLATLKSAQPEKMIGIANTGGSPIDPARVEVAGLPIGASKEEFGVWLQKNSWKRQNPKFDYGREVIFSANESTFDLNAISLEGVTSIVGGGATPIPQLGFAGPRVDCRSSNTAEQTCGVAIFGNSKLQSLALLQNLATDDREAVVRDLIAKYGTPEDRIETSVSGRRSIQLVWGKSFLSSGNLVGSLPLTSRAENYQIEAHIFNAANNRTVLIIQLAALTESINTNSGSRPKL